MLHSNIFGILQLSTKEDVLSNLFGYCLRNSSHFFSIFSRTVLGWPKDSLFSEVRIRMRLPGCGIPDIVIVGGAAGHHRVGIIELKLHATEGDDQTGRYADDKCQRAIADKLNVPRASKFNLVFLTLYPNQAPDNQRFRGTSLRPLLASLKQSPVNDDRVASQLLLDWVESVDEFYAAGSLNDEERLVAKLSSDSPVGGGFLAFTEFFNSIKPRDLSSSDTWRNSPLGRPYYGIKFCRPSWHPHRLLPGDWADFDPSRHFDIHIECQYELLRKRLKMFIHYEANPYVSSLESKLSHRKFDAHMKRRAEFKRATAGLLSNNFVLASDSRINQIAHATIALDRVIVSDSRKEVKRLLSTSARAVDQALSTLS